MITWVDVMNDDDSKLPGQYRQNKVVPELNKLINSNLTKNLAIRLNLKDILNSRSGGLLSCCAHGERDELIGYDNKPLIKTGEGDILSEYQRIIHLKACWCALDLGNYLIQKGCWAFFGYNRRFSFPNDSNFPHLDKLFFYPDEVLAKALAEGRTAEDAHNLTMEAYKEMEEEIKNQNNPGNYIGILRINKKGFCSPSTDENLYGNKYATINDGSVV
ncbi:MAG: hypothetical protein ACKV1O_05540 [Saprospiraceae bacterium]